MGQESLLSASLSTTSTKGSIKAHFFMQLIFTPYTFKLIKNKQQIINLLI